MKKLVEELIEGGYLRSEIIQKAFSKINRRDFVLNELEKEADKNIALPIGFGKQILKPQMAAFLLENLNLTSGQKILCLGSNSGWMPNLLAEIVGKSGKVIAIDEIIKLQSLAHENSQKYDFEKEGVIKFVLGAESEGFSGEAPYDRIVSLVSFLETPQDLEKQLKIGGKMLIQIKNHYISIERKTHEHFLLDEEIQLKDLKNRISQKIFV